MWPMVVGGAASGTAAPKWLGTARISVLHTEEGGGARLLAAPRVRRVEPTCVLGMVEADDVITKAAPRVRRVELRHAFGRRIMAAFSVWMAN